MDSSLFLTVVFQPETDAQALNLPSLTPSYGSLHSTVFECKRCSLTFPDQDACQRHIDRTQRQSNQNVCVFERCVERFGSKTNLRIHYERTMHDQVARVVNNPENRSEALPPKNQADRYSPSCETYYFDAYGAMDLSVRNQRDSEYQQDLDSHPESHDERDVQNTAGLSTLSVEENALERSASGYAAWEQVEAEQQSDACYQVGKSDVVESGIDSSRSRQVSGFETASHPVENSSDRTVNKRLVTSYLSALKKSSEKQVSSEEYKSDKSGLLQGILRLECGNTERDPVKDPVEDDDMRHNLSAGNAGSVVSDNKAETLEKNNGSSKRSHDQGDSDNGLASHKVLKVVLTRLSEAEITQYTTPDVKTRVAYPGLTDHEISKCFSARVELEKLPSWQVTRTAKGED